MKSEFAGILGIALTASFGMAVPAFRNGSATLATARDAGIIGDNANIWARPLRQEQIDGYHLNYRPAQPENLPTVLKVPAVLSDAKSGRQKREHAPVPTRLSA
jgi:hypothetical protein